jgi:predicted transcriptional regulator of viral defense system
MNKTEQDMTSSPSRKRLSTGFSTILLLVQSEYLEMPGLTLTEAQARRLWNLDGGTCRLVLSTLVERGFLKRLPRGVYVRAKG